MPGLLPDMATSVPAAREVHHFPQRHPWRSAGLAQTPHRIPAFDPPHRVRPTAHVHQSNHVRRPQQPFFLLRSLLHAAHLAPAS